MNFRAVLKECFKNFEKKKKKQFLLILKISKYFGKNTENHKISS